MSGSSSTFNTTDTSGARKLDPAPDAAEREAKEAWQGVPDEARGAQGQKYPEGAGDPAFGGHHSEHGYVGGSRGAQQEASGSGHTHTSIRDGGGAPGGTGDVDNSANTASTSSNTGGAPGGTGDVDNSANTASTTSSNTKTTPGGGTSDVSNSANTASTTSSNASAAPGYISSVVSNPAQTGKPKGKNITEGGFESDDTKNASFNAEIGSEDDPGRAATEQLQTRAVTSAGAKGERQEKVTGDGQYDALDTDQSL